MIAYFQEAASHKVVIGDGAVTLDDMARMWLLLGAREKQLLHLVTTRLLSGQQQYGKLTPHKKNAAKETLEEACDASIYTAMGMLDLMDEGK